MSIVESSQTGRRSAEATPGPRSARPRAPLGPVIALSVVFALGVLFVVAPLMWRVLPITELSAPLVDHHQDAETLIFILTFALLMPLGIVGSSRILDRTAAGPNAESISVVAALLTIGLELVVIITRLSAGVAGGGGPGVLAAAAGLWWVFAAALLRVAASPRASAQLARAARRTTATWLIAGLLLGPVVLSFTHLPSISWPVLLIGAAFVAAVLVGRERVRVPKPSRGVGVAVDLTVVALLLLAIPNLNVFAPTSPTPGFEAAIIQFHQNFFLGPANQILAGKAMLVDVLSQYGVGSIYFLAAIFTVIPMSSVTLGVVEGILSALMFIGTFATLRIAGVSRLLAASTMAVAVIVLVYGLQYPLGGLLQHGAIRFGLPVGVIVGAVAESRWPRAAKPARGLQLLTVAIASVWALEGFAYTLFTVVVVAALYVVLSPAPGRRRVLVRWCVQIAVACVAAHFLLAVITLVSVGELPDWSWYLNTLREFLVGKIGDITYDFSSFSPGYAVGACYLASASALVLIVMRRPDLHQRSRTMLIAIGAMTAYGVALLSYLVNRSADHIIPYVCLPVVALGALWLTFLRSPALRVPASGRRAGLGIALAVSALLVAVAWSSVGMRYEQSALAYALPGGPSLTSARDRLRDPPAVRVAAPEGERLLSRYMPNERESIVLTGADLAVEILVRSERGSAVPFGDPFEDSFVPDEHLAPLGDFVDGLKPGDLALFDAAARTAFDRYQRQPALDPFAPPEQTSIVPVNLASLQLWVLREMSQRFDVRTVAAGKHDLEVVELVPLRAAS